MDNTLYELAFQLKSEKLWEKLSEEDLFAVRLPDGEIGYCSVMGMAGKHYALALYPGERGIQTYYRMLESEIEDPITQAEYPASLECLTCSFESKDMLSDEEIAAVHAYTSSVGKRLRGSNAFPLFTKFRIGRYPWKLETEQDELWLRQALCAALHVSKLIRERGIRSWRLPEPEQEKALQSEAVESTFTQLSMFGEGAEQSYPAEEPALPKKQKNRIDMAKDLLQTLPLLEQVNGCWKVRQILKPKPSLQWPTPAFTNGITVEYLRRVKKKGVWECGTMYSSLPVQLDDDELEAPFFPMLLVSVKHANGRRLDPPILSETGEPEELIREFADCLRQIGCPKTILTGDDRCFALLSDLCEKIGVELDNAASPRYLYEAMEDLLSEEEEEYESYNDPEKRKELCEMLMSLPDEAFRQMPPSLKRDLRHLSEEGMFPEEVTKRLNRLNR